MMTKSMLIATLTCTIFMTIGAVAQTNLAGADVKVTIPFNFYAGDQSLPAGTYIVKTEIAHRVIILRGEKTPGLFVTTNRLEAANLPEHGQLTFKRYGSNYFLQEVWVAGRGEGQQIRVGKLERELASKSKPVEMVMVQPHSH